MDRDPGIEGSVMSVISRMMLVNAALEIRSVEATLSQTVSGLVGAGTWSGADAERFQSEWQQLVSNRLLAAATRVDGASMVEL